MSIVEIESLSHRCRLSYNCMKFDDQLSRCQIRHENSSRCFSYLNKRESKKHYIDAELQCFNGSRESAFSLETFLGGNFIY